MHDTLSLARLPEHICTSIFYSTHSIYDKIVLILAHKKSVFVGDKIVQTKDGKVQVQWCVEKRWVSRPPPYPPHPPRRRTPRRRQPPNHQPHNHFSPAPAHSRLRTRWTSVTARAWRGQKREARNSGSDRTTH